MCSGKGEQEMTRVQLGYNPRTGLDVMESVKGPGHYAIRLYDKAVTPKGLRATAIALLQLAENIEAQNNEC